VLVLTVFNFLAFQHARGMLTFSDTGTRTPPPQSLSAWQKLRVLVCGIRVPRPTNTRSPHDLGLPFETHRIPSSQGAVLETWLLSSSPSQGVVLLFHGYAGAKSSLLPEALALHELGYTTVLVDFRGSGGSNGQTTSLGYYEADDVAAAVRHIRSLGLTGPLILYGQSMGGAAVLRSVAQGVRPDAIIVESVFDRMLTTARNRFALMGAPAFPAAELLVFWGGVQVGFSGFEHNPAEYARSCDCPALVLHGEEDQNAKLEEGMAVYENLPGIKWMASFPGVGHTSLYGAAPQRWRQAVRQFLAEVRLAWSRPNDNSG
jgi:dipeptidyl aminopeptidase/acylaminoacyl peptidase